MNYKLTAPIFAAIALVAGCATSSAQDMPGRHPAYLHALADLRDARWNLEHRPGDRVVGTQENIAVAEIDHAFDESRRAAIWDGKDLGNHEHEDASLDHPGRLHHALELLHKAHDDVHQEEDNPETRELRHRIDQHIDAAIHATENAIHDVEEGR